jgi:hypothetical protein
MADEDTVDAILFVIFWNFVDRRSQFRPHLSIPVVSQKILLWPSHHAGICIAVSPPTDEFLERRTTRSQRVPDCHGRQPFFDR